MLSRLDERLRTATQAVQLPRIARWWPLLGRRSAARAWGVARVLRLHWPGLHVRTLSRSERHTVAHSLWTVVVHVPCGPAPAARPRLAPAPAPGVPARPALPDARDPQPVAQPPTRAPAEIHVRTNRLRTLDHTRVEREHKLERSFRERIERITSAPTPSTAPEHRRERARPPIVRTTPAPTAPPRPPGPPEVHTVPAPEAVAAATPPPPTDAIAPVADIEELVDRVLHRIERRAIAQRERLGV